MKIKLLLFIFLFLGIINSYGQLSNFSIQIDVANETCLGNGKLTISTSATVQGASLIYYTYKLPDTTIPFSNETEVTGLTAGDYRVVVTQQIGDKYKTKQQDITVQNKIKFLTYEITSKMTGCKEGSITVNVLTSNAVQYEIFDGPEIVSPQTSNVFEGLESGKYSVRVYDECGEGVVTEYTLNVSDTPVLTIDEGITPDLASSCDYREYSNDLRSIGNQILYPLTVKYTIHPPVAEPDLVIEKTILEGPESKLKLSENLPIYPEKEYTYDVTVTDICGKVFKRLGNVVNPIGEILVYDSNSYCDEKKLIIQVSNLVSPFKLNFDKAPSGFNSEKFNVSGPFKKTMVTFSGKDLTLPFGFYAVTVTDACGFKATAGYELKHKELKPYMFAANAGCDSQLGHIEILLPQNTKIVKVAIVAAPEAYKENLPKNVSDYIGLNGFYKQDNLPVGFYDLILKDECGYEYEVKHLEVPVFKKEGLIGSTLPDCTFGSGSVSMFSGNGILTSVKIVAAPESFDQKLPYDASSNLNVNGQLSMENLPEGDYKFECIDICGYAFTKDLYVGGYKSPQDDSAFKIIRNCGSFDIDLKDKSIAKYKQSY